MLHEQHQQSSRPPQSSDQVQCWHCLGLCVAEACACSTAACDMQHQTSAAWMPQEAAKAGQSTCEETTVAEGRLCD